MSGVLGIEAKGSGRVKLAILLQIVVLKSWEFVYEFRLLSILCVKTPLHFCELSSRVS